MGQIRIIHTGDLHLGNFFPESGFADKKIRERSQDLLRTFSGIVRAVTEKKADMLIISGDFFEEERVRAVDINKIVDELSALSPVPVVIAPGNHDYFRKGCLYDWLDWPSNVYIFREKEFAKFDFEDIGLTVYGTAFTAPEDDVNHLAKFKPAGSLAKSVLVYHGSLAIRHDEKSAYRPFAEDDLFSVGVDYIALGHYHKRRRFMTNDDSVKAAYAGSPEPLSFGEIYEHSYNLVTLNDASVDVEYIPTGSRKYFNLEIDCTNLKTDDDVVKASLSAAEEKGAGERDIVRFALKGMTEPDLKYDINYINDELRESFFTIRIKDETLPGFDLDAIISEQTSRGLFVKRLKELINDAERAGEEEKKKRLEDAIYYGLAALDGRRPEKR